MNYMNKNKNSERKCKSSLHNVKMNIPSRIIHGGSEKKGTKTEKEKKKEISALDMYDVKHIRVSKFWSMVDAFNPDVKSVLLNLKKASEEIVKLGFKVAFVPRPQSKSGRFWLDYPFDYIKDSYGDNFTSGKFMYFVIDLNQPGKKLFEGRDVVFAQYSDMGIVDKKAMLKILDKHLSGNYRWNGKNTEAIQITLQKVKRNKVDLSKLKEDDRYPQVDLLIFFDKVNFFKDDRILMDLVKELQLAIFKNSEDFVDIDHGVRDANLVFQGVGENLKKAAERALKILIKHKKIIRKANVRYYESETVGASLKTTQKMFK